MLLFPDEYSKPKLLSLVEASKLGWGAVCSLGNGAGTGGSACSDGGGAGGSVPVCIGGGSPSGKNDIYYRSTDSNRLLNPDDVNSGL